MDLWIKLQILWQDHFHILVLNNLSQTWIGAVTDYVFQVEITIVLQGYNGLDSPSIFGRFISIFVTE